MSRSASGNASRTKTKSDEKNDKQLTNGHQDKNNKNEVSSSSDEDDEPIRAPLQLKVEFVNSVMFRQWEVAKKLCQFILMYEPDNNEAKQYAPLIDYMLSRDQGSSSSDDDDDDDDDDDSTSGDDGTSTDSDDSSDSSVTDEEKPNGTEVIQSVHPVNASLSKQCTHQK